MTRSQTSLHTKNAFGRTRKGPGLAQRVALIVGTGPSHLRGKASVYRSEQHRRRIAMLPCINCGIYGISQAAHLNLSALGKGAGLKTSDALLVPLCAADYNNKGCHHMLDQSGAMTKEHSRKVQLRWIREIRALLIKRDHWPDAAEADYQALVTPYLERQKA